jgi:predicted phage-related endonuclease
MIDKILITSQEQWLAMRQLDVTASDIGSLCGIGRRTPLKVFAAKQGLAPPLEDGALLRRGRWCEPAVFKALQEERPGWDIRQAKVYLRDSVARLGCTPDGVAVDAERPDQLIVVQTKVVARPVFRKEWLHDPETRDDQNAPATPPMEYQLQTITEAMLAEADRAVIVALVLDTFSAFLRIFDVSRHPQAEANIRAHVAAFWADVDAGRMPAVNYDRDGDTFDHIWPKDNGEMIDLSSDNMLPTLLDRLEHTKSLFSDYDDERKKIETQIKEKLGPHSFGRVSDGRVISWKWVARAGYQVKPTRYRAFRILTGEK